MKKTQKWKTILRNGEFYGEPIFFNYTLITHVTYIRIDVTRNETKTVVNLSLQIYSMYREIIFFYRSSRKQSRILRQIRRPTPWRIHFHLNRAIKRQ